MAHTARVKLYCLRSCFSHGVCIHIAVYIRLHYADFNLVFQSLCERNEQRRLSAAGSGHHVDVVNPCLVKLGTEFCRVGIVVLQDAFFKLNRSDRIHSFLSFEILL